MQSFDPQSVLIKDRFRLVKEWQKLSNQAAPADNEKARQAFFRKVERSQRLLADRADAVPRIQYPDELPVVGRLDDIKALLEANQVVILAGETGSGKTTQIPKICLELGRGRAGMIGHTQPRRLAARAVANRLAEELQCQMGQEVGYQVRFTDHTTPQSLIKVMTDGILLAETQHDRYLNRYDTIVIDEAHERSLNIDFLLGYLKNLLPRRPDLKLVITSATIEVDKFSVHFDKAPVIEVSGRTYPVEVRYRPLVTDSDAAESTDSSAVGTDADLSIQEGIVGAVREIEQLEREAKRSPGDILAFLVGEREIRETAKVLRDEAFRHTEIVPLYARLSQAEQNRIFQPHKGRRIVLATNVAETSLTVPGIRYVIDPGYARISRYSYRSKVQRLPVEAISKASADQRKGRCGRVEEGVCIRLYSEEDFQSRQDYTDPEIQRTNLASVILQMLALRLGEIASFPFIQPPDKRYINDGYKLLEELGAVSAKRKLTGHGRQLSRFPIEPRLANMLLAAEKYHALKEILVIVSALAIQDPRERPHEKQQAADEKHAQWKDEQSEFIDYLNLWNGYEEQRQELSNSQLRNYCKKNYLAFMRMREWRDTHRQLRLLCHDTGLKENQEPATYEHLHHAILSGLISQVGQRDEKQEYTGPRQRRFLVFPGSKLRKKGFPWIVSAELVETSRLFARTIAKIEPSWIEHIAPHLLKTTYLEPHWSKKRGEVQAYAQISLYGLVVVPRRRASYGPIEPQLSRELMIRSGLVEGEIISRLPFIKHNQARREAIELLEAKTRRRDLIVNDDVLYDFYDQRIPEDINTVKGLEYWFKNLIKADKDRLILTEQDLLAREVNEDVGSAYPDQMNWRGQRFALDYHFGPGTKQDGITLKIPPAALQQLPVNRIEWLVPGMLQEKCEALIRSLPKSLRRNFVPVPDFAKAAAEALQASDESILESLSRHLRKMTGVAVGPKDWNPDALPEHLKMTIAVVDRNGRELARGRDYHALIDEVGRLEQEVDAPKTQLFEEKAGLVAWDFGKIQESIAVSQSGTRLYLYPFLRDDKTSVTLTSGFDQRFAQLQHRLGLSRLFMLSLKDTVKFIKQKLPKGREIGLLYSPKGQLDPLLDDLVQSAVLDVFIEGKDKVLNAQTFQLRLQQQKANLVTVAEQKALLLHDILQQHHSINKMLKKKTVLALALFQNDVKEQLQSLLMPGFLTRIPGRWLEHYPRYLQAVVKRLDDMPRQITKEREFMRIVEPLLENYRQRLEKHRREGVSDAELEKFRWMLEEFRVSYFAQTLGTAVSISEKKLHKQWELVRF